MMDGCGDPVFLIVLKGQVSLIEITHKIGVEEKIYVVKMNLS